MEKAKAKGARIGRPKIPPFTIEKVLEMKEQGCSYKEITKNLRCQNLHIIKSYKPSNNGFGGVEGQTDLIALKSPNTA